MAVFNRAHTEIREDGVVLCFSDKRHITKILLVKKNPILELGKDLVAVIKRDKRNKASTHRLGAADVLLQPQRKLRRAAHRQIPSLHVYFKVAGAAAEKKTCKHQRALTKPERRTLIDFIKFMELPRDNMSLAEDVSQSALKYIGA